MKVFKILSFRHKIFFSQLALFCIVILLLFPFIEKAVNKIVHQSLQESTDDLIQQIKSASSESEMINLLKVQENFVYFRVSLLTEKGEVIYDSHIMRVLKENFTPLYPTEHPEVLEALKRGVGYSEGYSQIFSRKFAYVAEVFEFQGKKYILRTAFPFTQVEDLVHNFELGFLIFSAIILLFFNSMTWLIFYRFSRPIQQIINTIKGYQTGKQETIPEITLPPKIDDNDDFGRLAKTLNSLSEKIKTQLGTLLEERNEKEAILESLGEGVIAVDAEDKVRYVNFIGSKMLGLPKRQLIGKVLPDARDKPSFLLIERCKQLLRSCQDRQAILTDSLSIGETRKVYLDLIAAPKTQGRGAIIVLQDKSSNYKVLEMGKDFVANASHELLTPITIIKGFAETLQDLPQISAEMLADITEKIVRNCQRMDNLVKNLLTLADIENLPKTRFKTCDLVALIENCYHVLLSVYPDARVEFKKNQERIEISADPDLLELALMNLFNNAAKYSKPPVEMTVSVEAMNEEVKIVIADRGIGIPSTDLEHIFERFYTVDKARSRRLGGAGLGLSIVKTIIEKHEGTIAVDSKLGQGTCFTIILPKER
ncbi:MAG: ATP-binding protein [Anaerolineae bacterium]